MPSVEAKFMSRPRKYNPRPSNAESPSLETDIQGIERISHEWSSEQQPDAIVDLQTTARRIQTELDRLPSLAWINQSIAMIDALIARAETALHKSGGW